jgi:aminomethyltransferase
MVMADTNRTILWSRHTALSATMTEFGGWEMPLYYSGIREEHLHTRNRVGLFDLCHMGRFLLKGAGFKDYLDWLTPAPIVPTPSGKVLYSFLLNESGGVIDDITIYVGDTYAMLVVNAANREKDFQWCLEHAREFPGVELSDASYRLGMLAVQGPASDKVMEFLLKGAFQRCPYFSFVTVPPTELPTDLQVSEAAEVLRGENIGLIYSATGYTGEHGYEIYAPAETTVKMWDLLIENAEKLELRPVGLGARDSLRLEAGMPLYGHELTEDTTPLEAGLARFLDFTKVTDFLGRAVLEELRLKPLSRKLVGLEMVGRGAVPRHGCLVKNEKEELVGQVTSGGFAPSLEKNIALAYVTSAFTHLGQSLQIEIRNRLWPAVVVSKQFYKRRA